MPAKPHRTGAKVLHLVPMAQTVSHDTVECLEALLEEARRGEIIGVCYAAMHRQRQYTVHSCGEAHRNPTYSAGMVSNLLHDLHRQAHGEVD
jgi:hypothetical protein